WVEGPLAVAGGTRCTLQVPAPPPASVTRTSSARLSLRWLTSRSWNESEAGSVSAKGRAARGRLTRPPPSRVTAASWVRALSLQAGPAVEISADLTCCGDQPG